MSILSADRPRDAEPLLVKPADAGRMLGCGRTRIYELVNGGEIIHSAMAAPGRLPSSSIHRYIKRRLDEEGSS